MFTVNVHSSIIHNRQKRGNTPEAHHPMRDPDVAQPRTGTPVSPREGRDTDGATARRSLQRAVRGEGQSQNTVCGVIPSVRNVQNGQVYSETLVVIQGLGQGSREWLIMGK